MAEKKSWLDEAKDSFKSGYEKEDRKISSKEAGRSTAQKVSDGVRKGAVEGVANPIRWIGGTLGD